MFVPTSLITKLFATDKAVPELLDAHTISEAKMMQIALGKLRQASGHYVGEIFAVDPHRIGTYSQRMMPAKKSKPQSRARKILQTFFCIDAIIGQPVAVTIGSSGRTASRACLELLDMMNAIIPINSGRNYQNHIKAGLPNILPIPYFMA